MVLSILCGVLGGFIYSVWGSRWFYLFCVGVWVVLPILCGDLGSFTYSVCGLGSFIYSVWGSRWFYIFCVRPG